LERLGDLLTKVQKSLGGYLERQRTAFARFYFIGDEDLLEIIGSGRVYSKPFLFDIDSQVTWHNTGYFKDSETLEENVCRS
jgi:hypothetical protein